MPPKFGTSGLRGLVVDLTDALVADHVRAFLATCPHNGRLCVARDLRESSPRITETIIVSAVAMGVDVEDCGAIPTPALAAWAMNRGAAAIMVTGSHIPADRNGLKFYTPAGEITKADETAILSGLGVPWVPAEAPGTRRACPEAEHAYRARYSTAFGPDALSGLRVGVYAHSAVGRDLVAVILTDLGASVRPLGRSDVFIPIDTEALDDSVRRSLADWAATEGLDAIVSTDGDSDRPLLTDATGRQVPGDLLGQITAAMLGAVAVATPVSSNSGVLLSGRFARVHRTRIGSPHVIAAMLADSGRVVGYEANGGFLLGFDATGPAGPLPALPTRDAVLPIVAALAEARRAGGVAARIADEPRRKTASDRLADVPTDRSAALVAGLTTDSAARSEFLTGLGADADGGIDTTDGLRMTGRDGRVLHIRPSGNAPELRLYVEADDADAAEALLVAANAALAARLA